MSQHRLPPPAAPGAARRHVLTRRALLAGTAAGVTLGAGGWAFAPSSGVASSGVASSGAASSGVAGRLGLVDPFIGTGGHGHTYPGATVPFGMVQIGPDTDNGRWDACSGYHRDDGSLMGFSHTHLSGTGVGDMLDVLVVPRIGPVVLRPGALDKPEGGYRALFSHDQERAAPGYYRVRLKDPAIEAELTATARAGLHRYHFPSGGELAHLLIDFQHGMQDHHGVPTRVSDATLRLIGRDTLVGGRRVHQWADGRHVYFALKLSRPWASAQLYRDDVAVDGTGTRDGALKCVLHLPDADQGPLLVKVGLSAVDIDGALRNLETEIPDWDFERVRRAAAAAWAGALDRIRISGGDDGRLRTFYTAYYHALLAPTLFSDVDGRYRGMDDAVHQLPPGANNYSTYSLWDTYRALHPFFTLTQETARVGDIVNCLVRMGRESADGPPVWPLQGRETGCMIGHHSAVVLAEAHAKNIPGVDYQGAWPIFAKRLLEDTSLGMGVYRDRGYIPADVEAESVSKTLEYAYDDWAVAHLAQAAGDADAAKALKERSRNYRNVFDRAIGFVRARDSAGAWIEPFDPRAMGHMKRWRDFTESNAWEATFLNQHDLYGYMALFGGEKAFEAKLDELFTTSSRMPADAPPDIAGLVGQYAHGNEPSHHVAYLYAYTGAHHKTQARVRQLMDTMYAPTPDGLAGNEDCGQMSAWYLLSALGLYPVDPVTPLYVFGSPLFERVEVTLGNGARLVVEAPGNAPDHPYIQSVRWRGLPHTRSWIAHEELMRGGTLVFEMGAAPNPAFGADMADRPPSFTDLPARA